MKQIKYSALFIASLLLYSCTASETLREEQEKPVNIIFLIGDGLGLSTVSTTVYFGDQFSEFSRFKQIGLITTSAASNKVTDSAASGTAMASGVRTNIRIVGMDTTGNQVQNIVEYVSALGWSTGIVVTSKITDATPASYYAHVPNRFDDPLISRQLLDSDVDFFAGGGLSYFIHRRDSIDLLKVAEEKGFIVDTVSLAAPGDLEVGQKYGFLLSAIDMPALPDTRGDYLPEAAALAITQLSKSDRGFFLMVEGSMIDKVAERNDTEALLAEMLDFEKTVAAVLDFAEKDGHTLVVVTGDHETGGVALTKIRNAETRREVADTIGITFSSRTHTGAMVPVFAYGPGAEAFRGVYDNTEIYHKLVEAISTSE